MTFSDKKAFNLNFRWYLMECLRYILKYSPAETLFTSLALVSFSL